MQTALSILHVVACIFLILVVLLQQGRGGGLGSAFGGGGGGQQVFGGRGAGNLLTRLTAGFAITFMTTSVTLAYLASAGDIKLKAKPGSAAVAPTQALPANSAPPAPAPAGSGEAPSPLGSFAARFFPFRARSPLPLDPPATPFELTALLGRGTRFEGKLHFEGRVRIDGWFKGEIRSDDVLIVGEGAEIEAEIDVATVIVRGGTVRGNIRARASIELHVPAKVVGDLHAPEIMLEKGVQFEGSCRMAAIDDPSLGGLSLRA